MVTKKIVTQVNISSTYAIGYNYYKSYI